MTMPPSGVTGIMDEEAVIEAEIRFELDNINLDAGDDDEPEELEEDADIAGPLEVDAPDEFDAYLKRLQDQTDRFQQELEECDDVLNHSTTIQTAPSSSGAVVLYDDHQLLVQLAQESGCDVEAYKQKILKEIENDEDIIVDELTDLIEPEPSTLLDSQPSLMRSDETTSRGSESMLQIREAGETKTGEQQGTANALELGADGKLEKHADFPEDKLSTNIQQAVEEGMDPEDTPVCQTVVPHNGYSREPTSSHIDIQNVLREQLDRLEKRYEERLDKVKKDQAFWRDEEEVRQKRLEEERQWKKQEYEREEQRLALERDLAQRKLEQQQEEAERQMQEEMRQFEAGMRILQENMEKQQQEHQLALKQEEDRQRQIREQAAARIQKIYKGYRVRKQYGPILGEKRAERRQQREEERIKEIEKDIERRNEEKKEKEEKERQRKEEEKRKQEELKRLKEEEKRQKELEKKQREEEKRRQKEEEERLKQEEKKRKEEEKKRKKEEEKQRKEEEKRKREEEKRKKIEEEQKRKEEKRLREEEEKKKKEEEKQRKIDEENKKKELEQERQGIIEAEKKKENDLKNEADQTQTEKQNGEDNIENVATHKVGNHLSQMKSETQDDNKLEELKFKTNNNKAVSPLHSKVTISGEKVDEVNTNLHDLSAESKQTPNGNIVQEAVLKTSASLAETVRSIATTASADATPRESKDGTVGHSELGGTKVSESGRSKTPRSIRTPRPPTPRKGNNDEVNNKKIGKTDMKAEQTNKSTERVAQEKVDCLPDNLEALRIGFIKDCLPWSKVSNEPWKLKTGSTRKPLRRPSSAKKLPPLADSIILQAGRVASLKQVTTVELTDLPGNNMSSLGQCTGLKYLVMTRCNLVALEGLSQCHQLQYVDVHDNKLEYVDLKDHGQLQYLNASHNRLSSIHGLDNCTNLRWLNLNHNNITRIGGLETLRRLHTLKLSNNQLISTQGLGDTPTLQMIDMSHNHLQALDDIHKLCLLLTLDLSANTLLKMPPLQNQVLLSELLVCDNNISSVEELSQPWLPLLHTIHLGQNSMEDLPSLGNCLLLRHLDLSNNQLLDSEIINRCVSGCFYLEHLCMEENPVEQDINDSFYSNLRQTGCPRLMSVSASHSSVPPLKPRTSFETMCLTQAHTLKDVFTQFDASIRSAETGKSVNDLAMLCDVYLKYCEKTFNLAVEYRYAHEYGEVSVTMPTAPTMPKSGRPLSARQKEKLMNPKDLFENALKSSNNRPTPSNITDSSSSKDLFENALKSATTSSEANPKDLFESALKSSSVSSTNSAISSAVNSTNPKDLFDNTLKSSNASLSNSKDLFEAALNKSNKVDSTAVPGVSTNTASIPGLSSITAADMKSPKDLFSSALKETEQEGASGCITARYAFTNGFPENNMAGKQTRQLHLPPSPLYKSGVVPSMTATHRTKAATTIQAGWRGYSTRKALREELGLLQRYQSYGANGMEHLHESAVKIQALWRGYILRKKLMAALEYAQCDFDDEDEEVMDFGDEFDLDKFVDIDQDLIDTDWRPPTTPDIPKHHPVLGKPPTGQPVVPPINTGEHRPPSNPRRAWKTLESPLSEIGKVPRPPSSVGSTNLTARSGVSKKEEKLTEEWGFRDTNTAHLMMQRAKKMKYNAERRKKISKLDPKQRLALFRRLEEVTHPETHHVPQRKILPRKEYFQARQEEIYREEQEKKEVFHTRASRTFEWLHTQVGDHTTTDSVINQGLAPGPKYVQDGSNLPELQGGRRVQLVSGPGSLDLQSVDSVSSAGHRPHNPRRFSAGSGHSVGKLPPIQTSSAPTDHVKERMSFRNPKVNQSVGWGGGKKRGNSRN